MPGLAADVVRALGDAYVQRLRSLAPEAPRITDKLPETYIFAGLIHLILPRARIIHVRRAIGSRPASPGSPSVSRTP
jgi:hypothetical protein